MNIEIFTGDSEDVLKTIPDGSIDLVVTSPPYDDLRSYNGLSGWSFEKFKGIAKELARTLKPGGVIVWVVGDATVKGSETGSSFRHALYFKECGLNIHDTMIWEKTGRLPTQDRYYAVFEYMFVLSKGKPKAMNFICDHKTVNGGRTQRKDAVINKGNNIKGTGVFVRNEYARRPNIWKIHVGRNLTDHPAIFPEQLAGDHILSWSNVGDTVLDPFMGSGTTGKMALLHNRKFIGIEKDEAYTEMARARIL